MNAPFLLNKRFKIDPPLGSIVDLVSDRESRLEPRLMDLICLLASHPGELVRRETITREIWDDYGNADEGLTLAISHLRKQLQDDAKALIETVPKKGYVLHAEITPWTGEPQSRPGRRFRLQVSRRTLVWTFIILVPIGVFLWQWLHTSHSKQSPDVLIEGKSAADQGKKAGEQQAPSADVAPGH